MGEEKTVETPKQPEVTPKVEVKKPVIVKDEEKSQKNAIMNSAVGKLVMSDHVCQDCGSPVLAKEWKDCAKCGGTKAVGKEHYKPKKKKANETKVEEKK